MILAACSDRPGPPRPPDTGPPDRMDAAAPSDDAGEPPSMRPDGGPRLPSVDREVVLPYFGAPAIEELDVEGVVGRLDVFFSIDTTGSFGGEIDNLQSQLRTSIAPALRERVDDVAFGVGRFEDFPLEPFGIASDRPFLLHAAITTDDTRVLSAVAALDRPLGDGGDIPESGAEALYQIATGEGYGTLVEPFDGGETLGGVGFRADALRVVVHVTDAPTHEPPDYAGVFEGTHSLGQAIDALNGLGVRVLGIASGDPARPHLERVAISTGAIAPAVDGQCATGIEGAARDPVGGVCPLVFDVREDGSGVAIAIVDAIADLLATVRYDEVWGETDDGLGFVRSIEASLAEPPEGIAPPGRADLRPTDGVDDTFTSVGPGTRLVFRATLRNETIAPADYDQIFHVTLRVVGDGVTLASARVRVIVPRGRLDAGMRDAGMADSGDGG